MIALQWPRALTQPELHRDLHQHVNRMAQSPGRGEQPLPNRIDRAFVEA
jgi:hypothetical protein